MPRARPTVTSFNAGELSPLLDGRVDQDKYFSGCKQLSNFIPTVQGPARRRGGTRRVGEVKSSAQRAWLTDFVFSVGQAYVLEFGDLYLRFWTNRGQLLNGGAPYEIASPYTAANLTTAEGTFALRTLQSGDVMWIVHAEGKYPPYRLSRLGATNWTLAPETFNGGPFRDINTDAAVIVGASGVTGSVTLTASTPIFTADHIGSLFLLESMNPGTVPPFQGGVAYAAGALVRNGGNVYEAQNSGTGVGSSLQRYVPVHTEGDAFDGIITWRYLHSGYGWGRITSVVAGGLQAQMDVIQRLPAEVAGGNFTRRWAHSHFSAAYGWPTTVAFFRERLVYTRGRTAFLSSVGDFNNFARRDAGLVTKETAMVLTLASDKFDNIRWIAQSRSLLLGSARAELSLQEQTTQTVFAADNAQNVPQTEYGSRLLRPLRVGESVLFVERAGHRIRDTRFSFEIDRYKAEDLTVLSEHLFDGSEIIGDVERGQREIVDWCYQQQRDSIVWCVLSDGTLAGLVINRERGVIAWTPHYIGGPEGATFVEAVQSIPSPDGRTDDLWMIVRRTVNGQTQRSVEYMTDYRLVKLGAAEAVHVDGSVTYRGAPLTTITGMPYFEGQTVSVCVDGANHPDRVVAGGAITLDRPGSLVHIGYRFVSRMQTMRLEVQGGAGTSQTARKAIAEAWLRLQSTIGGRVGPTFDRMDEIKTLDPRKPVGTPPALYSGDYKVQFPAGFDTDGYVCFEQRMPLPATLVAVVLRVQIND
ncbi:MAG: hypothetical protein ABFD65_13995 [Candidatus Polarisedimenticolia bacterium]